MTYCTAAALSRTGPTILTGSLPAAVNEYDCFAADALDLAARQAAITASSDRRLARGQIERIGGEAIITLRPKAGNDQDDGPLRDTPPRCSTSSVADER